MNRYEPMIVFAFSMILFTRNAPEAAVVGILLIVSLAAAFCVKQIFMKIRLWVLKIFLEVVSIFLLLCFVYQFAIHNLGWLIGQRSFEGTALFILIIVYIFYEEWMDICKALLKKKEYNGYGDKKGMDDNKKERKPEEIGGSIYYCAVAYLFMMLIGALRELLSFGTIFGVECLRFEFLSKQFQSISIGLILAGVSMAFVSRICCVRTDPLSSWWVVLPCILLERPGLYKGFGTAMSFLSFLLPILLYYSTTLQLRFSITKQVMKGLPIQLISLALIYFALGF